MPHSLCLSLRCALGGQEDAVLLRHALQCGTKQWGKLERSGQLKRSNKSCCNRYIFLRRYPRMPPNVTVLVRLSISNTSPLPWPCGDGRKFTERLRQNLLLKHLGVAAFPQAHVSLDGHSQPLLCQDLKQQQQQQSEHSEGVGAAALTFGGLSYEECATAFLAPHARCCLPPAPPNLSSLVGPPPASQTSFPASETAAFSAAAASTTIRFPISHEAFPVAAASNAAALRRALKRPRDDCEWRGADQRLPGGRDSRLVQSGLVRNGKRVEWPHVGSESALPDDVLLGCSSDESAFIQRSALSAPPPTLPLAALPVPMPPQLAALSGSAPCIGDFAVHGEEWLRVGSESALPDDVLLGLCCEDPSSAQPAALSAPVSAPAPAQPLAAQMPSPLAGLPGPARGSSSKCVTAMLAGSTCGTQELEYLDACIDMLSNITNTDNIDMHSGTHSGKDNDALFLDTPVAHVLLGGSPLAAPLASGPHAGGPAVPRAAGTALPEWVEEQGGTGEGGGEGHRQQQYLAQESLLAQWEPCQYLELDRMLSLPPHQPQLHSQPPPQLLPKPLLRLPTRVHWLQAQPCCSSTSPLVLHRLTAAPCSLRYLT
ncbi:unnamed protein product [Closterium sp. NIES-65]|nr:unnamed protein product [Closterium sp. NIES-65]